MVKHFWAQPTVFELRKPTNCFSVAQSLRPVTWCLTLGNCRSVSGTRGHGGPGFCLHLWGCWLNIKVGSRRFPSEGCCYLVAKLCPIICHPVDCSPPDSSVHGIFQVRILEWVDISFSRGSSRPRDWTQVSRIAHVNAGNLGSILGRGIAPGEGNGHPLQYSCLDNLHGQRSLVGCKQSDMTEQQNTVQHRTSMRVGSMLLYSLCT